MAYIHNFYELFFYNNVVSLELSSTLSRDITKHVPSTPFLKREGEGKLASTNKYMALTFAGN